MSFSLLIGVLAAAFNVVAAPVTARADQQPADTRINTGNQLFAYAEAGENLDVSFVRTRIFLDPAPAATVTVTAPGGAVETCDLDGDTTLGDDCTFTDLTSTTAGIWTIDFSSPGGGTQGYEWSIDVQDGATDIPGRVWSTQYTMNNESPVDFSLHYVSEQGFRYDAEFTGYNGISSNFTADAAGNTLDGTCTSAYKSFDGGGPYSDTDQYDQPIERTGECGDPYKIFFEDPADDLPATATLPDGSSTWVLPPLQLPDLTSLTFEPATSTSRNGTFAVQADNFTGQAVVQVDVNNDGDYDDVVDRELPVGVVDGAATVEWDGLDGEGDPVSIYTDINARAVIDQAGEIHFVNSDVETRGGLEVTATNGPEAGSQTLYWDDTDLRTADRLCTTPQLDGTAGVDSAGGAHGWTCFLNSNNGVTGSWGDTRAIDDWTFQQIDESFEIEIPGTVQPVFSCAPGAPGLLFQYPVGATETNVFSIDLASGEHPDPTPVGGWQVNAVGYNVLDEYVYGFGVNPSTEQAGVVRIGSDGSVFFVGRPTGPGADELAGGTAVGDVDDNNHYWMFDPNTGNWWDIDLSTNTIADHGNAPTAGLSAGVDWAFVPGTNKLWRLPSDSARTTTSLVGFDLTTHTWTTPVSLGSVGDNVTGAVFADPDGNLYASYNATGEIWRVNTTTNQAALLANGPASAGNDGARCADSLLPIDFGDAPDSYDTTLASDGPRHSLPDFADDAAPLVLGDSVTIEGDGTPGTDAAADDDDALPGPITLAATGTTTVSVTATNDTNQAATLAGWIDLDGNGTFEADELVSVAVPASSGTAQYELTFPAASTDASTYARFRLFPGAVDAPLPTGTAAGGEVEDYAVLQRPIEIEKTSTITADSRPGDVVTYTVTGTNTGTADYTEEDPAFVWDSLVGVLDDATLDEASLTATIDGEPAGEVGVAESLVSWTGALAAGDTVTVTYSVTLTGAGDRVVENVAWVPNDPTDPTPEPPVCEEGGNDPETGEPCATTSTELPYLSIDKSAETEDGTDPQVGDTVTYTVVATNDGPGDFTATAPANVVDDMTAVLDDATLVDGSLAATLDGAAVAAPTFANGRILWSGALAAGEVLTITYEVTYTGAGDAELVNVAFGPTTPPDPENPPPTPVCNPRDEDGRDPETGLPCALVTLPAVLLDVTKDVSPADGSTVLAGQELTYTITFDSIGTAPAPVEGWRDYLAGTLDDAEIVDAPVASDEALTVSDIADGEFSVDGVVPAGEAYTVTYTVRVLPDADRGDNLLGNFVLPPGVTEPPTECLENDPHCTTNFVPEVVDSKSVDPAKGATVVPGQEVTYTLTFSNEGTGAGSVDRVDDLTHLLDDADVTVVPTPSDPALSVSEIADGRFSITGELAADQTVTVSYTVVVKDADAMGDAVLANFLLDPEEETPVDPVCEEGAEDCTSNPAPKILDSKSVDPETGTEVEPGEELTYTLTFTNEGTAAGQVDEVDDLTHLLDDADVTVVPTPSDPALSVSEIADGRFSITGELAADQTVTVSYTVVVKDADAMGDAVLANFLLDPEEETPVDPVCEEGDEDCTSNPAPKILDSKSVDPETGTEVEPGEELTYTLTFTNEGTAAGQVDRVDDLTHVLDDAEVVEGPVSSDEALSVSELADDRFSIVGELQPEQTVTVSYTVRVDETDELGDAVLANFLLDPSEETPTDPVCEEGDQDCTTNPTTTIVDSKSASPEDGSTVASGEEITYTLTFSNEGAVPGAVDRVDDLSHVLDDADLTVAPQASDEALSVSEVVDGRFSITGELAVDQTVTVTYTATIRAVADMGDATLANFVVDPDEETPTDPVCEEGDEDCTQHLASKVVDSKSVDPETGTTVEAGAELTYTLTFSNEGTAVGEVDRVDDLTHVLDDAEVVEAPVSSDEALSVGEIADNRFSITGELEPGQTVTVSYTVQVNGDGELGDAVLANFLLDPSEQPPAEPVCEQGEDCTVNGIGLEVPPVDEPPAQSPGDDEEPPAQSPGGDGQLPDTGAPAVLLPLLAGLALALTGGGLLVRRRLGAGRQ
ncbi:DUF7927 domain-containing protein [Desertihabitans aurantiacus]|uniref:DUF7927 domain-containing protein n=1 Tax=Desertihabitans aurantiacus TaxID=2282477 RepID=UPI000DF84345|nr:GEVED domain-containing protein [Desertihabitans aurantiacus]